MNIAPNSYQQVLAEARAHRSRGRRQMASGIGLLGLAGILLVYMTAEQSIPDDQWCSYEDKGVCTLVEYN